jgi:hypothetical protein
MTNAMTQVLQALDTVKVPINAFIRDDDAGWEDARLMNLLDVAERSGVPIDLAAIPLAVSHALARDLCIRIDRNPDRLGVHQHGYAHTNHQADGRASEFGSANDLDSQRLDLERGRALLLQQFGHRLDAIFTPPWNRCASSTPGLLGELGYTALSRDRGATPQHAISELSVDIDWCKHYGIGGLEAVARALTRAIHGHILDALPLGLMLHHAVMDAGELAQLEELLGILGKHPGVRWTPMREMCSNRKTAAVNDRPQVRRTP